MREKNKYYSYITQHEIKSNCRVCFNPNPLFNDNEWGTIIETMSSSTAFQSHLLGLSMCIF